MGNIPKLTAVKVKLVIAPHQWWRRDRSSRTVGRDPVDVSSVLFDEPIERRLDVRLTVGG